MNAIDATAMAICMFEGARLSQPNIRNLRNNNPGNLRRLNEDQIVDGGGYRIFPTFAQGWQALTDDITYKVKHHLQPTSTMLDFFNLYAPAADHNDPHGYAQYVVQWLTSALMKEVTLTSTIQDIYGQQ